MNIADFVGVGLIVLFISLGVFLGSLRMFSIMMGTILAFKVAEGFVSGGKSTYVLVFLGVTAALTAGGFLLYGATKFHIMDAMEGVFGAALGLAAGWGLARFIFHTTFLFSPQSAFAVAISSSLTGMDIYYISPIANFLNMRSVDKLRNPDFKPDVPSGGPSSFIINIVKELIA